MPVLYVIAGPNGIGKTTSSYDIVPAGTPIINSDEIAKEVRNAGLLSVNVEYSNQEAIRLMEDQRKQKNSFAIETNLADVDTWKFLLEVQKTGYELHVLYMSTDDIDMLNERIEKRALMGDHFVKPDVVKERYIAGLKLLDHYFRLPDKIQLFDNSEKAKLVLEVSKGDILFREMTLPEWTITYLRNHLQQQEKQQRKISDLDSIEEVRKSYDQLKQKSEALKKQNTGNKQDPPNSHKVENDSTKTPRRRPKL